MGYDDYRCTIGSQEGDDLECSGIGYSTIEFIDDQKWSVEKMVYGSLEVFSGSVTLASSSGSLREVSAVAEPTSDNDVLKKTADAARILFMTSPKEWSAPDPPATSAGERIAKKSGNVQFQGKIKGEPRSKRRFSANFLCQTCRYI